MLEFLGIILLLIGIALLIIRPFLSETDKYTTRIDRNGREERILIAKRSHPLLLSINKKVSFMIAFIGILLITLPGVFFYAQPGKGYAVFYPWGGQKAVLQQGISTKWWGKIIDFQMEIPIKDILEEDMESYDKIENVYFQMAVEREFSDAVKGEVANSMVIGLNLSDDENFLLMAKKNRSERNLVYSRIIPYRDAVIKNTAKLMSAQEYISGASAEFDRAFKDQMENGMYILEEVEIQDDKEKDIIGDMDKTRTIDDNNAKRKVYRIKTHKVNGVDEPLRNEGSLVKEYGLTVIQAVVNIIDWELKFDERLDKQKEQVALTQLEKQMAEKAIIKTQRLYQEGESNKTEERAKLEKEQIQKTIAAETRVKEEQFNLQASKIQLEKDKIDATRIKVTADADAYKNQMLVKAGLTPQQRATIDKERDVEVAKEIAKLQFPNSMVIINGDAKSNGSPLESLIGAAMAKQLLEPNSKVKKE